MRKIIHIDMDAFYASVEQRDNPSLKNKPVVIGSDSNRGVIAAASYEARKYGIHSAMSSVVAKRHCRNLIFVKGNMNKYKSISKQIKHIFYDYTDLVEPLSFDEAYLDVTKNTKDNPSATLIAQEIKHRIKKEINLTSSAGISYNKFLAKIASDVNKPDGLFIITPQEAQKFIDNLSIDRFFGIGRITAKKMHKMGIFFGSDLKKISLNRLNNIFGKQGDFYYKSVRGIDNRKVNPNRERKSLGNENTFSKNLTKYNEMEDALLVLANKLYERLKATELYGRTLTLKMKHQDFNINTKSKTFDNPIVSFNELCNNVLILLSEVFYIGLSVRLLGISVSNFLTEEQEATQLQIDWLNPNYF